MLSTVQIGITSIGILAGAFSGATIARHIEQYVKNFPLISSYSKAMSVGIVVVTVTYFSLIIGELVPKHIALSNPEKFSLRVARPIQFLMRMTSPLVALLSASTTWVLRLIRVQPAPEPLVTEEEIQLLIAEGTERGVFEKSEQKMVESIFHLGNRPIKDFMTPRDEVVWLDIHDSFAVMKDKIRGSDRSVFPVCDGDFNNNLGVVETKDILSHVFDRGVESIDIKPLIQPVMYILAYIPSLVAIERFKRSAISIALIIEESKNSIIGMVSFHDILEAIVGEFKHT